MAVYESSIIIPVFNQWELTSACLFSLAETIAGEAVQVIVVDNASSDSTAAECPLLGRQLFGDAFLYRRNAENMNFGPASNRGAYLAQGEFLIFLNNDTVALPNWYRPLIADFSLYPDIAATGPVLLYPESQPFGHTVQHLGVFVSPLMRVGHLYEGIPADSPLTRNRRFFQIITAACMVMRRSLFLEAGMFDEKFINGYEDVDLCARLRARGYRMTINPESRLIHYQSQTQGRHKHEKKNAYFYRQQSRDKLKPDLQRFTREDGMSMRLTRWQTMRISLPENSRRRLDSLADALNLKELTAAITNYPFWQKGWEYILKKCGPADDKRAIGLFLRRFFSNPGFAIEQCDVILSAADIDRKELAFWFAELSSFCKPIEFYLLSARRSQAQCAAAGLPELAAQYADWLGKAQSFTRELFLPFMAECWRIIRKKREPLYPQKKYIYTAWTYNIDNPRRLRQTLQSRKNPVQKRRGAPAFSILMPVYNPDPEYLLAAINSVIAQDYPLWQLCLADDASTDPRIKSILKQCAAGDERINVQWRPVNGNISAATNTALAMARNDYAVLLDQDDLLTQDALRIVAEQIEYNPNAALFYSDEDKLNNLGILIDPYFKNGKWDWDLLLSQNYVSHLGVYRVDRLREIDGFRDKFNGAQDYDMLLRYAAGLEKNKFIHIPRVLYHWRAHEGSTANDISAKRDAIKKARTAIQEWLDIHAPGSRATELPGGIYTRVIYPAPQNRPAVSLIFDLSGTHVDDISGFLTAFTANTRYENHEIYFLAAKEKNSKELFDGKFFGDNVRILAPPEGSPALRLQWAAAQAQGNILGFFSKPVLPVNSDWLNELVSRLCQPEIGACGGKLTYENGKLIHAGYSVAADGTLKSLFENCSSQKSLWFGWNILARNVDALDALCLFTKKETFFNAGGFDLSLPSCAAQDYCLRLGQRGLRVVWWPYAEFTLPDREAISTAVDSELQTRWRGKLKPCNPNLLITGGQWSLWPGDKEGIPLGAGE